MATKSCWVQLVGADGKALAAGAKRIKKELEIVDDLRDAVQDAYKQDVLAHVSACRLIVYAPEDGERKSSCDLQRQCPLIQEMIGRSLL